MSAYTYTITVHAKTEKKLLGFPGMIVVSGTLTVTNYNGTTPVQITQISSKFKGAYAVILTPRSTGAVTLQPYWDHVNETVRYTVTSTGVELADDAAGVMCSFVAIGV